MIRPLSHAYSSVQRAALKTKQFTAPAIDDPTMPSVLHNADKAVGDKVAGDSSVSINKQEVSSGDVQWLTWSAYHAENQQVILPPPAINVPLPLFT